MKGIGHLGNSQKLGKFRPQHARASVYGLRPAENRVGVYPFTLFNDADCTCEDLRSPADIRSLECRITDKIACLCSETYTVPQNTGRGLRSHTERNDPCVRCLLLHPERSLHGIQIKRIDHKFAAGAENGTCSRVHFSLSRLRRLLHTYNNIHDLQHSLSVSLT